MTGSVLRRPSASSTPSGKLNVMPTTARSIVSIKPPHSPESTKGAKDHSIPSAGISMPPLSMMNVNGRLRIQAHTSTRLGKCTLRPIT